MGHRPKRLDGSYGVMIAGPGVPTGGATGQFLEKNGPNDYNTIWSTISITDVQGLIEALDAKVDDAELATIPTAIWGNITGVLANQLDLQAALNGKANSAHSHVIADTTGLQVALDSKVDDSELGAYATDAELAASLANYIPLTQKGAASGVAPLNGSTLIDAIYLPSYVDDVVEYANLAAFPATGESGKIYVALDSGKTYRWTGSAYTEISSTVPAAWGTITGTLSNQTDLQIALNGKAALVHTHAGSDITGTIAAAQMPAFSGDVSTSAGSTVTTIGAGKVTLAMQANMATASLVYRKTGGAGAPEVQTLATLKTDLGLTGTNSGDQTSIVGITGTIAQFNTACTDADFATVTALGSYLPLTGGTLTGALTISGATSGLFINTRDIGANWQLYNTNGILGFHNGANRMTIDAAGLIKVPSGNLELTIDDAYAVGWNGSLNVPTKNAVYDKIEAVIATIPAAPSTVISDTAYGGSWDGVTTIAPSKNAVWDKIEAVTAGGGGVTTFNTRSGAVTLTSADVTGALTYTPASITDLANYLPLTGGTLSGNLTARGINSFGPQTVIADGYTYLDHKNSFNTLIFRSWASGSAVVQASLLVQTHFRFQADAGYTFNNLANTINYATINATGLAVTGTITATGAISGSNLSGTNTGDQTTVTGNAGTATALATSRNFSISGSGITAATVAFNGTANVVLAASVDAGHVTLARMADMATASLIYRKTAGSGVPEVNTLATLKTDLGLTGTNSGDQTSIVGLTGTIAQFNAACTDADFATTSGVVTSFNTRTGAVTLTTADVTTAMPAFTGDVTNAAGAVANTIAAGAVTLAKMANVNTGTVFYRKTAAAGAPEVQTLATLKTDLGIATDLAAYLPLIGGTLTGDVTINKASPVLTLNPTSGGTSDLILNGTNGSQGLQITGQGVIAYFNATSFTFRDKPPTVNYMTLSATGMNVNGSITLLDEAYAPAWDGKLEACTKNAVYDKIQTIVVPQVGTSTSAATLVPVATNDMTTRTTQTVTLAVSAPTGTPVNGWGHVVRIKATAAIAVSWNATYRAIGITLPLAIANGKTIYVGMIYNSADSVWDCVSLSVQA